MSFFPLTTSKKGLLLLCVRCCGGVASSEGQQRIERPQQGAFLASKNLWVALLLQVWPRKYGLNCFTAYHSGGKYCEKGHSVRYEMTQIDNLQDLSPLSAIFVASRDDAFWGHFCPLCTCSEGLEGQ